MKSGVDRGDAGNLVDKRRTDEFGSVGISPNPCLWVNVERQKALGGPKASRRALRLRMSAIAAPMGRKAFIREFDRGRLSWYGQQTGYG